MSAKSLVPSLLVMVGLVSGCDGGVARGEACQICEDNLYECDENPPEPLYIYCAQDYCDCMEANDCKLEPGSCGA